MAWWLATWENAISVSRLIPFQENCGFILSFLNKWNGGWLHKRLECGGFSVDSV